MPTLYDYLDSGNGYKIRLLLAHLQQPYRRVQMEIFDGATRTPQFLAKNPNGWIPTLELDDGTFLAESNAIMWYLAENTPYLPQDRLGRAQALQWMFFEQYSHEPFVATSRAIVRHFPPSSPRHAELPERRAKGHQALAVMEGHLARRSFFVNERYSIADIALYAYTHVAPDGGIELGAYPNVLAWIGRVASQPRHILITDTPMG
jgi:glutathione S-transferase